MWRHTLVAPLALATVLLAPSLLPAQEKARLSFWDTQKRGANFFNEVETRERFRAARDAGLEWVRLVPDKWKGAGRDFLLGNAGDFQGIVPEDMAHLEKVLGWAQAEGVRVVMGMLNLPGCRWVQKNEGKQDYRLWNEERYQEQAAAFWKELASKLKDHPAVVAYNPLNEPHPAREDGHDGAEAEGFPDWLQAHRGTTADLDRFNARIVGAIREVDPHTPVLVEGYGHGSVSGLTHLLPVDDPAILYSFHFYEPWQYTARKANKGRYAYPDQMPAYWNGPGEKWERNALAKMMDPVGEWATKHGVPTNHIVAAEFGCDRAAPGAREYLEDVVTTLNERGWHWAFYSFREDVWDRMDYEVGPGGLGAAYWEAVDRGETPERPRGDNPLWRVLQDGLRAER
jgi:aryl-phospho-beta-D-glucosidase BglC (GH1 family)